MESHFTKFNAHQSYPLYSMLMVDIIIMSLWFVEQIMKRFEHVVYYLPHNNIV